MIKNKELAVYESDASTVRGEATKVFYPKTALEIKKLIMSGEKFTIRGAGTGLAGGAVPQNEAVIDLSKMNSISGLNLSDKTVEVEAGVILDELNEYLEKYNLEFPVKPGSHSVCTIGGMIATNAAGERAVKYGKTDKWVEGIEVVDGRGEILEIKKFSLNDFAGMEGITGIIVKAKIKLDEKKRRTATLIAFENIADVINAVDNYSRQVEVSEIEFLDKLVSSLLGFEEKYHLIVELEDDSGELKDKAYDELMKKRDSVYPTLASQGYVRIEDPKIHLNRLEELNGILEHYKVPYFGHIGIGVFHPVFRKDDEESVASVLKFVKRLKGSVSGEHGIGISKKAFLGESEKKIIERVKKRYDANCKINCGKVIDL